MKADTQEVKLAAAVALGACPPSTPTDLAGAACTRPGLWWDAGTLSGVPYREADGISTTLQCL